MANPTTAFGWVMPNSSDLVTDLPADFAVFGQGVDTSMQYLLGGTTGQVLSKTSGTNMAFTWTTPTDQTPLTTKGDLFTFTTVDARLGIGTNNQVLTADSAQATGMKWAAVTGAGKVLQVVQATYSTSTGTTSTSFVDSGLSGSITPSAASSKIMVIATLPMKGAATVGGDIQGGFQLVRGATAIQAVPYAFSIYQGASQWKFMQTLSYLDSPSTTSSTTYKIQITALGGSSSTITAQSESNTSVLLLLEIGA